MSLVCLGTILKSCNFDTEIVDFDLELRKNPALTEWNRFKNYAIERLATVGTKIFGISSICSNFPITLLLSQEIKKKWPSSKIILGGPQPSSVPEQTLKFCPWVDVIVIGEGETTLTELAASNWSKQSLHNIDGIAFYHDDQVVRTKGRELISDLDNLPLPDFSLLHMSEYFEFCPMAAFIEAGRGCPFLCSFCSTSIMWERKFRAKSPERILQEMQVLNDRFGLTSFGLTHDNFTTSHRYVAEFCKFFEVNNKQKFSWLVSARTDTLNLERLRALKRAGCSGLFFGVDTGSTRIQDAIKKHLNLEQVKDFLKETISLGIKAITSFVLGFSEETEEDLNQTIYLALEAKLLGSSVIQLHRLAPLSGTSICDQNTLLWDKGPTDQSINPIECLEIETFIKSNPKLFSSFYSVPTPHLEHINIAAFAVFYDEMINKMANILQKLLLVAQLTPAQLFCKWMNWRSVSRPHEIIEGKFIADTLGQFINESFKETRSQKRSPVTASI